MRATKYQIDSDGETVWVNTSDGCIGRFGKLGIDIHQEPLKQASGRSECLFCTHGPTGFSDWELFCSKMKDIYKIYISESYTPRRFSMSPE